MNKIQKRGCIFLLTGMLLTGAALTVHLLQRQQDQMAKQTAQVLLDYLEISRSPTVTEPALPEETAPAITTTMPEKEYMGHQLLGTISVPSVGIRLPVLSQWDSQSLNVAPCRYLGSIPEGNMILMGHRYESHFAPLLKVEVGAEVEFIDALGKSYRYRVEQLETLHRNQGQLLASDHPLILFTCTPGGIYRQVVRCQLLEDSL